MIQIHVKGQSKNQDLIKESKSVKGKDSHSFIVENLRLSFSVISYQFQVEAE